MTLWHCYKAEPVSLRHLLSAKLAQDVTQEDLCDADCGESIGPFLWDLCKLTSVWEQGSQKAQVPAGHGTSWHLRSHVAAHRWVLSAHWIVPPVSWHQDRQTRPLLPPSGRRCSEMYLLVKKQFSLKQVRGDVQVTCLAKADTIYPQQSLAPGWVHAGKNLCIKTIFILIHGYKHG